MVLWYITNETFKDRDADMVMRYGVGIDIGTSKIGAVLVDAAERRVVRAVSRGNDAQVCGLAANRHEQSPARIVEIAAQACRELLAGAGTRAEEFMGGAVTGQMHGVLVAGTNLAPVTPLITWRDRRTVGDFLAGLQRAAGIAYTARTGCALNAGYGGATLAWLRQEGAVPVRDAMALTIADYLAARLCGVAGTAASHAASWGIFDLRRGAWDAELLRTLEIPAELLPPVRDDRPLLGGCTHAAAELFGLPEGLPVWLAVGDNQASVYAAADGDADCAVLNLGTGGQISLPAHEVVWSGGSETRPLAGGGLMRVGASLCGGWSYAYLCEFFRKVCREIGGVEISADAAFTRMTALAQGKSAGTLRVDPRFAGSRDGGCAGGAITGINVDNLVPAELVIAFQEGMVRELAELAGVGAGGVAAGFRRLVATGNAVRRNPGLPRIIEKIFGMPCALSPHLEEAGAGAALWMFDTMGLTRGQA